MIKKKGQETETQAGGFPIKTIILPKKYDDKLKLAFKSAVVDKQFKGQITTEKPSDLDGIISLFHNSISIFPFFKLFFFIE
jgi:hypothetical protein